MKTEQRTLQELFKQYSKQIKKDHQLRNKVADKLVKFAPYKKGDRVMWMPSWMFGGGSVVTEFKRYGIIASVEYVRNRNGHAGHWLFGIMPTTKQFKEHGSNKGHEWLTSKQIRKAKL